MRVATLGLALVAAASAIAAPASPWPERPRSPAAEGQLVFSRILGNSGTIALWLMSGDGSRQRRLTQKPLDNADPVWSPDGRRIAFARNVAGTFQIFLINPDSTGLTQLTEDPVDRYEPAWTPNGTSLIVASGGLEDSDLEVFDVRKRKPRMVTSGGAADLAPVVSSDGRLAFTSNRGGNSDLFLVSGGDVKQLTNHPGPDFDADWSPDGKQIAFARAVDGNYDIYVLTVDSGGIRRLTKHPAEDVQPSWSPDGEHIAFVSYRDANYEIYVMDADGSDQRNISKDSRIDLAPDWQPTSTPFSTSRALLMRAADAVTLETCSTRPKLRGTPGTDVINGTASADVICAFGGADTIDGKGGNDIIFAGDGRDVVFGGGGNDQIIGGSGQDKLYGGGGNDKIAARDGKRDVIDGGPGKDGARADPDKGETSVTAIEPPPL